MMNPVRTDLSSFLCSTASHWQISYNSDLDIRSTYSLVYYYEHPCVIHTIRHAFFILCIPSIHSSIRTNIQYPALAPAGTEQNRTPCVYLMMMTMTTKAKSEPRWNKVHIASAWNQSLITSAMPCQSGNRRDAHDTESESIVWGIKFDNHKCNGV